ncbi:abasic site processing protein HMCES isoform X1 [Lepisosteus oculatus]|uniref:abasic site processing protein HMCES isoform X1 n=1 Tax=Lepisosteus oculatus TaxID=7918 RepID=UPI00371ADCEB
MCGRTACTLAPQELSRAACYRDRAGRRRRPEWRAGDPDQYRPSYNKSPQSLSPVLLSRRHLDKDAPVDECVVAAMRWGLVPAWFQESDPQKMQYSTSNCRSESLLQKKSYKEPLLKGQRCVVLADGFYEWQRQKREKQPFFIYFPQSRTPGPAGAPDTPIAVSLDPETHTVGPNSFDTQDNQTMEQEGCEWTGWRLLTLAGLFDCWSPPGGGTSLYTYTIITVEASQNLQSIHDRMPAVLDGEEEVRRWLDFGEIRSLEALSLLRPNNTLTFHPVSTLVNNSRNNSPECVQPVEVGVKKAPPPSASSKAMMTWLQSASPQKRKEQGPLAEREKPGERGGGTGAASASGRGTLQNWLIRTEPSKKARTG